ncbi:MAG: CBS domain-containing protein [Pirellulales bacterium]
MVAESYTSLITYNPLSVRENAPISEAVELFVASGVSTLPVVDAERKVRGVIRCASAVAAAQRDTSGGGRLLVSDMVREVKVQLNESAAPSEIIDALLAAGERSLPIVREGRLIGVVSRSDVLREFSYGELECSRRPVSELMHGRESGFDLHADPREVLKCLRSERLPLVVVLQGECPVGVATVEQLCKAIDRDGEQGLMQIATLQVVTCLPQVGAAKAAELLLDAHGLAVAVVDRQNCHLGTLTVESLLELIADALRCVETPA